ncbi:MAG: YlxR family protein [Clostridia bacterium]|nr:YlxR family protein [Clostridia bacterium]
MAEAKKVPVRRCVGCGEHFPKNTLIRVLRTPSGEIVLDLHGKASGRGAYVCKSALCLRRARKSGRISASLECPIPEEVYDRLESEIAENE